METIYYNHSPRESVWVCACVLCQAMCYWLNRKSLSVYIQDKETEFLCACTVPHTILEIKYILCLREYEPFECTCTLSSSYFTRGGGDSHRVSRLAFISVTLNAQLSVLRLAWLTSSARRLKSLVVLAAEQNLTVNFTERFQLPKSFKTGCGYRGRWIEDSERWLALSFSTPIKEWQNVCSVQSLCFCFLYKTQLK